MITITGTSLRDIEIQLAIRRKKEENKNDRIVNIELGGDRACGKTTIAVLIAKMLLLSGFKVKMVGQTRQHEQTLNSLVSHYMEDIDRNTLIQIHDRN